MSWEDDAAKFNYNMYNRELVKTLKRIRRSWKRKDVIRLLYLIDITETYESYPFYVNVTEKYGLTENILKMV